MIILSGSPNTGEINGLESQVRHQFPAPFRPEWRTRYRAAIDRINRATDREIDEACRSREGGVND